MKERSYCIWIKFWGFGQGRPGKFLQWSVPHS